MDGGKLATGLRASAELHSQGRRRRFPRWIASDKLRGQWIDSEAARIRLSEVAERCYLTTAPLKPKTRSGYRSLLNSRILPYLGGLQLRQIDPVAVREWVAELQEDGLSACRIRQARNVLHAVFNMAVDGSMVTRNPVAGARNLDQPIAQRNAEWTLAVRSSS